VGLIDTIERITRGDFEGKTKAEREGAAREVILASSFATAGLVLQPIPGLEHGAIPLQIAMVVGLSRVFGEELSRKRAKEVVLDIAAATGVNVVGRQALTTLAKIALPGLGGVLAAPAAFAVTYATGHAAVHYFSKGGKVDRDQLKAIFDRERKRARQHYSDERARDARPTQSDVRET
jgi:uncharacterized protein (DUF697 family)